MAIIENVLKNENGDNITVYIEVDEEHLEAPTRGAGPYTTKSFLPRLAQDAFTKAMDLISDLLGTSIQHHQGHSGG